MRYSARVRARKLYRLLSRSKDEPKLKPKLEEIERWAAEVGIGSLPVHATLRDCVTALADESSHREIDVGARLPHNLPPVAGSELHLDRRDTQSDKGKVVR